MTETRWRKSSYSGTDGDCVELAGTLDALRDSKNPVDGVLVTYGVRDLVRVVKGGRFAPAARMNSLPLVRR